MKKIILILGLIVSTNVIAAFECSVDVKRVLVYADGTVNILHSGRNDYTVICDLDGDRKGVSTVTCAMWTSLLQSTQNNNKNATFYYSGEGSCATLATYGSSPAPVYIGSVD
jgi:hypothetical protein